MKKKTLALLLMMSCTLSMTACGNSATAESDTAQETEAEETEPEPLTREEETEEEAPAQEVEKEEQTDEEPPQTTAAQTPTELSDDLYDFQLSIDGVVYQFPMWYADFEALGWEYDGDNTQTLSSNQYSGVEIWKKDGIRVYTKLANLSMNTVPYSESMVAGITLEEYYLQDCDWEILLPGGIQYGVSGREDIVAAYGDPTSVYDGDINYKMTYEYDYYQEIMLYVDQESDTLLEIELENIVELEGADNSVDATVPDLVKAYEAPASLGDDFYAFTAQLEGVVYSLPCPVSVLVENGFRIEEDNSDSVVASDSVGWVTLSYNNQKLRTMVENYADYATTIENCFAISMESSVNGPTFDLVFPGGIEIGDTEAAVQKATQQFNCEVETSASGFTYYTVSDPDGSVLDEYQIVIKDGTVCTMEVSNSSRPEY